MALPKLETPTYKVKIPSTGKQVTYRPFLVKEEKLLLMLGEGKDTKQAIDLVTQLLNSCVQTKIDVNELTTFDLEYLFLNLRAKSVGEEVSIMVPCDECKEKCPVDINLDEDVYIEGKDIKDINFTIPLTETVGLEMKFPSVSALSTVDESDPMGIIIKCIKSIYDETTVHNLEDYTEDEVKEFVNSLGVRDVQKLQEFFEEVPKVKCKVKFTCPHCGHENEFSLEGLANFI